MLTAQFAFQLEPVIKQIGTSYNDFKVLQRDILVALGFVVAVDFLQMLVQQVSK